MRVHQIPTHLDALESDASPTRISPSARSLRTCPVSKWRGLLARHAVVHNALETELRQQHGIGVSEFEALERLADGEEGKCRGTELTDAVHLSQSAASRLVARMERDGLVERSMCEMDRRGIFVVLTDGADSATSRRSRPTAPCSPPPSPDTDARASPAVTPGEQGASSRPPGDQSGLAQESEMMAA